jgi:anti-sigma B factor antagonist
MTQDITRQRSSGSLPDWHSTFTANADTTTNTVYARGVLDLLTVELLRGKVEDMIRAGRVDITIDLTELSHIDHAGLLLLGGIWHDLAYRGGSLTLINAGSTVREALGTVDLRVTDPATDVDAQPEAPPGRVDRRTP